VWTLERQLSAVSEHTPVALVTSSSPAKPRLPRHTPPLSSVKPMPRGQLYSSCAKVPNLCKIVFIYNTYIYTHVMYTQLHTKRIIARGRALNVAL
jgi:hypothetical protein